MLTIFLVAFLSTASTSQREEDALTRLVRSCRIGFQGDATERAIALVDVGIVLDAHPELVAGRPSRQRTKLLQLVQRGMKDPEMAVRTEATCLLRVHFEDREAGPLLAAQVSRMKDELMSVPDEGKDDGYNTLMLEIYWKAVITALRHRADAGSVKGLQTLQRTPLAYLPGNYIEQIAEAQLSHGIGAAFESVIDWIPVIERAVAEAKSSSEGRGRRLTGWYFGADADTVVHMYELLHDAAVRVVPDQKAPIERSEKAWRSWLRQARPKLPEKSIAPAWAG